jgi:outer membrane protein assembly factor BamB
LIVTLDGVDLQYTIALDKQSGQTVWKTNRSVAFNDENVPGEMARLGDLRKAHSTPIVVTNAGQPLLLSAGAKAFYAYDPRSGRELWMVHHTDASSAPRPLFDNGLAYFVSGLFKADLYAIKVDGHGDVTDTHVAWQHHTHIGKYSSPILADGLIYTAAEQSFLTCLDAATGDLVWTERIGGSYEASPIYADGRLYFFDVQGHATVIKPGRACNVLATNTLDDGLMASPSVAGKAFYIRTRTHLYRIEDGAAKKFTE